MERNILQCTHTLAHWSQLHLPRIATGFDPSTLIRNALTDYPKEPHRLAVTNIPFLQGLMNIITEAATRGVL